MKLEIVRVNSHKKAVHLVFVHVAASMGIIRPYQQLLGMRSQIFRRDVMRYTKLRQSLGRRPSL
jgi:hypothetical protein